MLERSGVRVVLSILALSTSSCAGMQDVVGSRRSGEGSVAVYDVTPERALEIAATVFEWAGADFIERHAEDAYVLAKVNVHAFTWGTVMGAWFEPVADGKTKVTVVTKRRFALSYSSDLSEESFHDRFAQGVAIIGDDRALPKSPPD